MKKILFAAIAAVLAFSACQEIETPAADGMTITVDKAVIESDGKDIATFTITDKDGNILTQEANMSRVFFKNVADGTRLPQYSTGFSSIADGEFEFVGIVNGVETVNSVKITSQNRANYEVFHKNVAIFKLTGTWCQNCPRMTTALHSLTEDAASHSIVLACHNEDKAHPFYVNYNGRDLASSVFLYMGQSSASYPTNCYDLTELDSSSSTVSIAKTIMNHRIESPASVGIKITEVKLDGKTLKVKATTKASEAGVYDMTCAILGDDLEYKGGYTDNDDDLYSSVVLGVSGDNFLSYTSKTSFDLAKDAEKERTFEFAFAEAPSSSLLEKIRAVVLVHKKMANGESEVNNCAECAYGSSVDYKYN